jgi:VIT1/CCC1 family predicted Fe2+/Mn2+ transporter
MVKKTGRKYLSEFFCAGAESFIMTLGIVAAAIGALLSPIWVLFLGFASLIGRGVSGIVSRYTMNKSDKDYTKDPKKISLATVIFFFIAAFISLLTFVAMLPQESVGAYRFILLFVLAGIAFFVIGFFRGKLLERNLLKSAIKTFIWGSVAVLLAFAIGFLLKGIVK